MPQRIVLVGGTSSLAEHCVRYWISDENTEVVLMVRNRDKAKLVEDDLKVRSPGVEISIVTCDFCDPSSIEKSVSKLGETGKLDIVLIAHGSLSNQTECQQNLFKIEEEFKINAVSPALFAEAFSSLIERNGGGKIVVVGSVAGDRGRRSNYIYGSCKGFLERYVQGLQHRMYGTDTQIILAKPGPTLTPMTAHLSDRMKLDDVNDVAKAIAKGVSKGKNVIYAPARWWFIMLIIKHLPRAIFNRMNI